MKLKVFSIPEIIGLALWFGLGGIVGVLTVDPDVFQAVRPDASVAKVDTVIVRVDSIARPTCREWKNNEMCAALLTYAPTADDSAIVSWTWNCK